MKHVIITGGSGFIGSHLCDRFLKEGFAVTAIDNLVTGRESNISQAQKSSAFQFIRKDICEPLSEREIPFLERYGLSGLLHFACPASPIDFEKIPMEILAVDSIGTMNTVPLAIKYKARYLIASTSEIYGDPLEHPQKETYWGNVNTIGPRACYDETKRFAEAYVSSAARWKGLNAGIVRIFNTYGPRMRPDDGRVVPELCMQALRGQTFTIHGTGKQTRSFCFVSDLVDGIFKLFMSTEKDPVNIGNPVERTMLEFAEAISEVMSRQFAIKHLESRPDDPRRRCPDIGRAQSILGWTPKVDLKEGLKQTLEYFKSEM